MIYVAMDLESTGLHREAEIIEWGAVAFDELGIHHRASTLICPTDQSSLHTPKAAMAYRVHGIRADEVIAHGIEPEAAAARIHKWLDHLASRYGAVRWGAFSSHHEERYLCSAPYSLGPAHWCAMKLKRKHHIKGSQAKTAKHLGIEVKGAHRALDDARVCADISRALWMIDKPLSGADLRNYRANKGRSVLACAQAYGTLISKWHDWEDGTMKPASWWDLYDLVDSL